MSEIEAKIELLLLDVQVEAMERTRNFEALINIHKRIVELNSIFEQVNIHIHVLHEMKRAYCFARLGKKQEAKLVLEKASFFSMYIDKEEAFRMKTLVTFFVLTDVKALLPMHINTIKRWLNHPEASKQVVDIIFDYKDFIGDIEPFNSSKQNIRQTNFSEKLIEATFSAMCRTNEVNVYYDRAKNDVLQEVEGYLTSLLSEDKVKENRILANRISNSDAADNIIDGVHFLIPNLAFVKFFEEFSRNISISERFFQKLEPIVMNHFRMVRSINQLLFTTMTSNIFLQELSKWIDEHHLNERAVVSALDVTQKKIALEFLKQVNR